MRWDECSSVRTDLREGSQTLNSKLTTGERATTEDRTDNAPRAEPVHGSGAPLLSQGGVRFKSANTLKSNWDT